MEQACTIFNKFLNCDAVQCVVNSIWFRILFEFCMVCGCCGGVFVCCRVFLDVLGLDSVSCGESFCCHMILNIPGRSFSL